MEHWEYPRVRRLSIIVVTLTMIVIGISIVFFTWISLTINPSPSRKVALILLHISLVLAVILGLIHLYVNRPVPRLGFLFPTARWEGNFLVWERTPPLTILMKASGLTIGATIMYLIAISPRFIVYAILATIFTSAILLRFPHSRVHVIAGPGYVHHTQVWRGREEIYFSGPGGIRWAYAHEVSLPAVGGPMLLATGDLQRTVDNEPAPLRTFGISMVPFTNVNRTEVMAWLRGETTTPPNLRS